MRRLANKPTKKQSNFVNAFDETVYFQAMKKFQKETRGLLPDSNEAKNIRNKIYTEMRDKKHQQEQAAR